MFPNTFKLVIDWGLDLIPVLLKNTPNLERITFEHQQEPLIVEGNILEEPTFCLRFQLKEIILPSKISLTQEEFTLIRYLLKHSGVLETLRINDHKIDRERRQHLLKCCGSECCRIEFFRSLY
nr:F-box/RNI-like superfamily protein [Tanacetum cinerariifolium]